MIKDKKQIKEIFELLNKIAIQYVDQINIYDLAKNIDCKIKVGWYKSPGYSTGCFRINLRNGEISINENTIEHITELRIYDDIEEEINIKLEVLKKEQKKNFEEGIITIQNLKRILK